MLLAVERAKFPVLKPKPTMSTLGRAYRESIISEIVLKQSLERIGYTTVESDWIKQLYDSQPKIISKNLSKSELLDGFYAGILDFPTVSEELVRQGYSLEDVQTLFLLNKPELKLAVKTISESACYKLWSAGLVDAAWVDERLSRMGYVVDDRLLLLVLNQPEAVSV